MIHIGKVSDKAIAVNAQAARNLPKTVAPKGTGSDIRNSIVPALRSSAQSRIEIAGITGSEFLTLETLEIDETTRDTGPTLARSAAAAAGGSFVEPRSSWATAEMQWACLTGPDTAQVEGMVVHHTAGGNSYTAADVPAIIRAIWRYHVVNRGWCDIAYNFLVDKFGQVWEGRQGGIAKGIVGGHTYGFNTGTSGVAQLGNFDTAGPPSAMTTATSLIVGWKLGTHGVDPTGTSVYKNRAPDTSPKGVPPGGTVTLPSVVGHRDLGSTSCPGANTYARRSTIRTSARTGAHALALHWSFLGRAPTLNEYRDLATGAQASGLLATADDLSHSREYAGVVITDLYRKVLRRTPDGPGMNYWLDQLRDGMTVAEMSVYFYGGREYYDRAGNDSAFVDALYRDILHRSPDVGGKLYWTAEMARGTTPPTVAAAFVDSDESRRDRVKRLYLRFLGRSPDPEGHAYWADVLRTSDDLALATFLALSTEYYRRVFR